MARREAPAEGSGFGNRGRGRDAIVPGLFPDGAVCYLWSMFELGQFLAQGALVGWGMVLHRCTWGSSSESEGANGGRDADLVHRGRWRVPSCVCAHWDGALPFLVKGGGTNSCALQGVRTCKEPHPGLRCPVMGAGIGH
jgi:hypothetical protein